MDEISVVIPIYNGLAVFSDLIDRLEKTLARIDENYQIILVDDRGPEPVWPAITAAAKVNSRIKGVRLSRNFGQHAAITAGMSVANARWYVVMDNDLQDRPEDIETMYRLARAEGVDSVIAVRETMGTGFRRSASSYLFNRILRWSSGLDLSSRIGNFRIFSDKVANAYRQLPEQMRLFPALMNEIGFETAYLPVPRGHRQEGRSSYSLRRLLALGLNTLISYSDRPLRYMAAFGLAIMTLSCVMAVIIILRTLLFGTSAAGWPSLFSAVFLFGGFQLFITSFVGLYVGQVLYEAKRRPIFITEETINVLQSST